LGGEIVADREVYFAKITRGPQVGAFDQSFADDILAALDPRNSVERYRRRWRASRPRLEDGFIVGKLGFVRTAAAAQTRYDEEQEDFVTAEAVATEGSFSMFAIDTATEILAFEERPNFIRRQSFLGAFRGLLQVADFQASVTLLPDPTEFREFVASVDRLQRIRAVVFAPNPGFREDARNFEEIIESANAQRAEVVAVAKRDESLNPEAPWVSGALDQISTDGKGTLKATGVRQGHKRSWTIGARLQVDVITDEDGVTPEDVWGWLKDRIRRRFRE
jgi:hypothetical protein